MVVWYRRPSSSAAEVVDATPTGVVAMRANIPIQVTFSEPLIALGETAPPDPAWFKIDPPLTGTWRWERPDVATFDRTGAWPVAAEVQVSVALPAERGGGVFAWSFQIEGIQSMRLMECREREIELEFNTRPDLDSLRDLMTVSFQPDSRRRPAAMTAEVEASIETEDPHALDPYRELLAHEAEPIPSLAVAEINPGARPGRRPGGVIEITTVVLAKPAPAFGQIEVTVAPGLTSTIGPGPSLRTLKSSCEARSPAAPTTVFSDDPANPLTALQFAAGLPYQCQSRQNDRYGSGSARAYKMVGESWQEVELHPQAPLHPGLGSRARDSLRASPGSRLRLLTLLPIGFPWRHRRRTGPAPEYIDMVGGHLVMELAAPRVLPLKGRAVNTARLGATAVEPADLAFLTERFDLAGESRIEIPVEFPVTHNGTFDLDLRPLVPDGKTGIIALNLDTDVDPYQHRSRERRSTLQVTDLALTALPFSDGGLLWVTRLSNGQPVADAMVSLVTPAGDLYPLGKSDERGLAWLSKWADAGSFLVAESSGDLAFLKVDGLSVHGVIASGSSFQLPIHSIAHEFDKGLHGNLRTVAFTDRGLYRPGDTVHLRVMTRIWRNWALEMFKGRNGDPPTTCVRVYGPDSSSAFTEPVCAERSPNGAVAVDLPLPADLAPGTYRLQDTSQSLLTIEVGEPRRPRLDVTIEAPPGPVLAGDGSAAVLRARHLTGLPLAGLAVSSSQVSIPAEPTLPLLPEDLAARLRFADPAGYRPGTHRGNASQQLVSSTETDDHGEALLSLADDPSTTTLATVVTATVEDQDGQLANTKITLEVLPGTLLVGMSDLPAVIDEGQDLTVEVFVVDPQGTAVPGVPIELTVGASDWVSVLVRSAGDRFELKSRERFSRRGTMTLTSAGEPLVVVLEPEGGGHVTVTAEVTDPAGRHSRVSTSATSEGPRRTRYRRDLGHEVELAVDEGVYRPGDVARVAIRSPWSPATAMVVVQGASPRVVGVIPIERTTTVVDVPLLSADVPDAVVQVVLVRGRSGPFPHYDLGTSWRTIKVPDPGRPDVAMGVARVIADPEERRLAVTVHTAVDPLRPGEVARVEVVVKRPDGSPAAGAEVTLWAVDEGCLALTAYATPDPLATVYAPRALTHLLRVFDSRIQHLARRLSDHKSWLPGSDGGLAPGVPVRANFDPVAAWFGAQVADDAGRVAVAFAVPDNLTTYRVMAVAVDGAAHFGSGENSLVVSQPLVVDPILPRFLRPGDRILAGASVHHLGEGSLGPVEVELQALPPEVLLSTAGRAQVDLSSTGSGVAQFALEATGPGTGEVIIRAAMSGSPDAADAVTSTVEVPSPPASITQIAVLHTVSMAEVEIKPPQDPISGGLEVEIGGPLAGLGEILALRSNLPLVRPLYAALTASLGGDFEVSEQVERQILSKWLADLERKRRGGWVDFQAEAELSVARRSPCRFDRPVPAAITATLVPEAASWLRGWQPESESVSTAALTALALAELGSPQPAVLQRLVDSSKTAAPAASWLVALALHASDPGDPRFAAVVANAAGSLVREGPGLVATGSARYRSEPALTTAEAIEVLTFLRVDDERIDQLATWLLAHRHHGRWGSGLSDPWSLWVLIDRLSAERGTSVPYRLSLGELIVDEGTLVDGRSRVVSLDHQFLAAVCAPSAPLRRPRERGRCWPGPFGWWTWLTRPERPRPDVSVSMHVPRAPGRRAPARLHTGPARRPRASVSGLLCGVRGLPGLCQPFALFVRHPDRRRVEVLESRLATSPAREAAVQDQSEAAQHDRFGIRWGFDPPRVEPGRVLLRAPSWAWEDRGEMSYCLAVRAVIPGDFLLPPAVAWTENNPELPSASASTRLVVGMMEVVP